MTKLPPPIEKLRDELAKEFVRRKSVSFHPDEKQRHVDVYKTGFDSGYASRDKEVERLVAAVKTVSMQSTSQEYEQECNDLLDGQTAIEAWDSLIVDIRAVLAQHKQETKEE